MAAKPKAVFLSLVFILITIPILADVLVLKNGKKLQGTVIKEDDEIYQLRDSAGIILTVKKSQVDAETTQKLNAEQKKSEPGSEVSQETKTESKSEDVSIADLARQARANKTGTARVLRQEDLEQTPEVSIIGTTQTEETIKDHAPSDQYSEKNEEYWKNQTRQFANDLRRVRDDVELFSQECEDLGKQAAYAIVDPTQYMIINGVLIPISVSGYDYETIQRAKEVCFHAEQAKKELARIEKELEQFQEQARREGALPGWVDPDRL